MAQESSQGAGASSSFLWVQEKTVGSWELYVCSSWATLAAAIQKQNGKETQETLSLPERPCNPSLNLLVSTIHS